MEFPELGKQCGVNSCKTLDFLPINCTFCNTIFCKDHSETSKHDCPSVLDNVITDKKNSVSYKCSYENCKTTVIMELKCQLCERHFCLEHRHHGCLDQPPPLSKVEKYRRPKEQFKRAKAATDAMVQDKLKKAKNRALANKIKLMKIKGSAVGLKTIPTNNRIYFLIAPPLTGSEKSKPARSLFLDKTWSWGRAIDFTAKKFNIENTNNNPNSPQLRLFSCEGDLLSEELSAILQNSLDDGTVIDGDSLILEYINSEDISEDTNIFVGEVNLSKYTFI